MLGTEEIDKLIEKYQDNDDLQGLIREYRALRLMRPDSDTPRGYAISVHNSSTARIDKAIIGLLYAFFYILRVSDQIFF